MTRTLVPSNASLASVINQYREVNHNEPKKLLQILGDISITNLDDYLNAAPDLGNFVRNHRFLLNKIIQINVLIVIVMNHNLLSVKTNLDYLVTLHTILFKSIKNRTVWRAT